MLHSFDIFDTLITRTTASPRGIFAIMQEHLKENPIDDLPSLVGDNFYHVRAQGEETARSMLVNSACQDVTLEEIYGTIQENYQLTNEVTEQLMQLELDTEIDNILPVTKNINKLKQLYADNEAVVLISDMYLSQEQIRKLLVKVDPVFREIKIYVSSEHRLTKRSGQLYCLVQQQENVSWGDWEHVGDNDHSDISIPLMLGMKAYKFQGKTECSWQKQLLWEHAESAAWQHMAGAVQRALGQSEAASTACSYTVGAGYSAPILYPYVAWVIEQSMSRGIQVLYFIARDGYVLKEIADMIICVRKLPLKTKYLYGSRKAWRLPSITAEDFDMQYFLKWNYPRLISSFQKIADIMGMTIEELSVFLPFAVDENMQLGETMKEEVFRILIEQQEEIARFICDKHKNNRQRAQSYLRQELQGTESQKTAFVELIGSGFSQKCLSKLVKEWFPAPVVTFFYRLDDISNTESNLNFSYFPNRLPFGNIIEILCPANHGQTLDYQKSGDRWEPVFGEDEGQLLDGYGFQDYMNGVRAYTEEILKIPVNAERQIQSLQIPVRLFKILESRTAPDLYDYIADMPYGIRGVERKVTSFIPKLTDRDLRKLYIYHKGEHVYQYYSGYDINYSLKRLTEKQKEKLKRYQKIGSWKFVGRIRDFFAAKGRRRVCNSKYDLIAQKVIIYGAGKKGKLLYEQLTKGHKYHADVLLWIDANYEKYQREGLCVEAPERICSVEYGQILIAVADKKLADEIKESLIKRGVKSFQILWIYPERKFS